MSVINDMLRDLDKRQAPEVGAEQALHQESLIGPQSSPFKKIIIITVLLLCALLVVIYLYLKEDKSFLKPEVAVENANQSIEIIDNMNVPQDTLKEIPLRSSLNNDLVKIPEVEQSINATVAMPTISENKVVPPIKKVTESKAQQLEKIQGVSSEIQKEQTDKNLILKEKPTDRQQKQTESNPLVASKSVINNSEITKPQKIIFTAQKVESKLKEQEQKAMQVTLSPIALDQEMAERALMLISKRQETQAYRELYSFIGEHEEDMESRTVLATYLLQENRLAEVGDVLLNAPLHKSPKLRQIKARWYAEQGEPKLALYTLNSDLPRIETYPEYYVLLAAYYQRYGTAEEAKETYSMLVDFDETVADWWAGLGLASDRNNEKTKAIFAYQQSLEIKGLSPQLLNFVKPRLKQLRALNLN